MFARLDENPAMTLQDIKKTKRYGRTDAHKDNVKTVYPPQTKFAGGIITSDVIAYYLVHFFSICVIHKCQSGIDFFFTSVGAEKLQFYG